MKYKKTYSDYEKLWTAIFASCELFRSAATEVGNHFGYEYNESDDNNMTKYLVRMKNNEF